MPTSALLGPEGEGWNVVNYALQYERVGAARYARAARTLDPDLAGRAAATAPHRGHPCSSDERPKMVFLLRQ